MPAITNRILTAISLPALLLFAAMAQSAAPAVKDQPDVKQSAARLSTLWNDLASTEDAKASRALLALAATPKDAVALLSQRLKPVKVDAARLKKLVEQLDDEEFDVRESASYELKYLDRFARPHLTKALEGKPSAEVKKRIVALLKRLRSRERPIYREHLLYGGPGDAMQYSAFLV